MEEYRLCYVEHYFAYFTTQSVTEQWGDDWNDSPFEYNAGPPYHPTNGQNWKILRVHFDGQFDYPAEARYFSVQQINSGIVAWMVGHENRKPITFMAGITLPEFIEKVKRCGGQVDLEKSEVWSADDENK